MTKIWLIADTHLDHKNIIKYCNRPFKSVNQMNEAIVRNWNRLIGKYDYVLVVGDFAFGKLVNYWHRVLNGHKIMIRGNHDRFGLERLTLNANGHRLLLVHNPADVEHWDNEWIIHGHKHNAAPLIDPVGRMVNVGVENIGYKPIRLNKVLELINAG